MPCDGQSIEYSAQTMEYGVQTMEYGAQSMGYGAQSMVFVLWLELWLILGGPGGAGVEGP